MIGGVKMSTRARIEKLEKKLSRKKNKLIVVYYDDELKQYSWLNPRVSD